MDAMRAVERKIFISNTALQKWRVVRSWRSTGRTSRVLQTLLGAMARFPDLSGAKAKPEGTRLGRC